MNNFIIRRLTVIVLSVFLIANISTPLYAVPPAVIPVTPPNNVDSAINAGIMIQKSLDDKNQELEIIAENNAVLESSILSKTEEIKNLEQDIIKKQQQVDTMQAEFSELAISYYKQETNDSLLLLDAVMHSKSISEAFSILEYYRIIYTYKNDLLTNLEKERKELDNTKERFAIAKENLVLFKIQYENERKVITQEIASLNEEYQKNKKILDALQAAERLQQTQYLHLVSSDLDTTATISAARKKVVKTALDQLGKSYVWGGAGPDTFDCSGLVVYSYKNIGINLIHHARDQYRTTKKISMEELKPGDLIFIGATPSTIHHVIMYIGNGYTIEAPRTGDVVKIRSLKDRIGTIAGFTTVFINEDSTEPIPVN